MKSSLFLKDCKNPFIKRLVIVPSPAIKSWLMLEMAKDEDLQLSFGVEIAHVDEGIEKLISKRKLPSELELALMIEVEIKKIIEARDEKWNDLFHYLKIKGNSPFSKKTERRLFTLSEKLAGLFIRYGTFGGEMVADFEKSVKIEGFQIELWKTIFLKHKWPYLIQEFKNSSLNESVKNSENFQVHLFSISFLSKVHFDCLFKISLQTPMNAYFLSPCQAFWSDIKSDKEHYYLKRFLKNEKAFASLELDEYLRDQNPLLANFGKIGREMAKLIELSDALSDSSYVISQGVLDLPQYDEFIYDDFEFEDGEFSLLKAIQADLSLLRNPILDERIVFDQDDSSIEVSIASSAFREVQILYDNLLHKFDQDPSLDLNDVIVMAPNIMDYEPFIKIVFGSKDSLLDFHIMDLNMPCENLAVQEFLHLISLSTSRFDIDSLMDLLTGAYFQKAQNLTFDDLEKIQGWFRSANLKWGYDSNERNELLEFEHCNEKIIEDSEHGTLSYCLDRLLSSLVVSAHEDDLINSRFERMPVLEIQPTDADLLGRVSALISSLKQDLVVLVQGKMTLQDWADYLECLVKAYFNIDETAYDIKNEELLLLDQFDAFRKASDKFKTDIFSFYTVKEHLMRIFTKETLDFREAHLNSVKFCSMLPMRAVPAKLIALIGMNEDSFPRTDSKNSLDLSLKYETDYRPSKTDYDRYLFLEALLSARKYFMMSYVGNFQNHSKFPVGSLVIQELLNYMDEGYLLGKAKFSDVAVKIHPFNAFDRKYFEKNTGFKSYCTISYSLAVKNYERRKDKHQFFPDFKMLVSKSDEKNEIPELILELKELSNLAKNPLKTYFNKTLGIYLKNFDLDFKSDEDFTLSHLDLSKIKKASLKTAVKDLLELVEKNGTLPSGLFKDLAVQKIQTEISLLENHLAKHSIKTEDVFNVDFFEGCLELERSENGSLFLPPLCFNYKNKFRVKIVGNLPHVCKQGLILHVKDDKVDVIKAWPEFIVFSCLMETHKVAEKNLIFAKCGKLKEAFFDNPFEHLENYLDYYFEALENASPLIPEWVFDFVHSDKEQLAKKMNTSLSNDFNPLYNDYLHWIRQNEELPYCASFDECWKAKSQNLYLELYEKWYP